jgi:hypothetical protein
LSGVGAGALVFLCTGAAALLIDLTVPTASSDLLLSIVVIVSGTVGALIAAMRQQEPLTIRNLALGLAAGFVTFLAIRGGKKRVPHRNWRGELRHQSLQ